MRGNALVLLTIVAVAGCNAARPAATAPSTGPAAALQRTAAPTTEPIHIETNSAGNTYPTVVQRVNGPRNSTRIAYRLRALSSAADIVGSGSVVTFEQPHITFFDRQGKQLIADSPQAKVTQRDKSVLMSGGVHARGEDGSVLTCDTLLYDGRTEKLHGRGHVVLAGPNAFTLTGAFLEGDVRLDDVRVAERPL